MNWGYLFGVLIWFLDEANSFSDSCGKAKDQKNYCQPGWSFEFAVQPLSYEKSKNRTDSQHDGNNAQITKWARLLSEFFRWFPTGPTVRFLALRIFFRTFWVLRFSPPDFDSPMKYWFEIEKFPLPTVSRRIYLSLFFCQEFLNLLWGSITSTFKKASDLNRSYRAITELHNTLHGNTLIVFWLYSKDSREELSLWKISQSSDFWIFNYVEKSRESLICEIAPKINSNKAVVALWAEWVQ